MYKGNDIIGKPIITYDTGAVIENIKDVLFDAPKKKILGFLVGEKGLLIKARILPFSQVKAIGADAITVENSQSIVEATSEAQTEQMATTDNIAKGTKVMTEDGKNLGTIADLYFDEHSGTIQGYEVSGGIFADAYSGKSFLPAPSTLKIGKDVAFVPTETADLMDSQVGGIKKVIQNTNSKADHLNHKITSSLKDGMDNASNAVMTQASEMKEKLGDVKDNVQNTLGRRVQKTVYAEHGGIIAAIGQLVDESILTLAREHHKEQELLQSTAVKTGATLERSSHQVQESASSAWDKVKEKVSEIKDQTSSKIEEKRIQAALGKPVTRVILDTKDNVILNTGGLITHEAIEQARSGGALEILLSSAYTKDPTFSSDELKSKSVEE